MARPQQAVFVIFIQFLLNQLKIFKEKFIQILLQLDEKVNSWWRPQFPAGLFFLL